MSSFHEMMGIAPKKGQLRASSTGTLSALNLESAAPTKSHPSIVSAQRRGSTGTVGSTKKTKNEPLNAFMMSASDPAPKHGAKGSKNGQPQRRRSSNFSTFSEQELQEIIERVEARRAQAVANIEA